jgi:hypothetical protein
MPTTARPLAARRTLVTETTSRSRGWLRRAQERSCIRVPGTEVAVRAEVEDWVYVAQFPDFYGFAARSQFENDLLLSLGLSVFPGRASAR